MEAIPPEQELRGERRHAAAHFRHVDRHRADDARHPRALATGKRAATLGRVRASRVRRRDAQAIERVGGYRESWQSYTYGNAEVHASTLGSTSPATATVASVQLSTRVREIATVYN